MDTLRKEIVERWPAARAASGRPNGIVVSADDLPAVCRFLTRERDCRLATIVAEQTHAGPDRYAVTYVLVDVARRRLLEATVDEIGLRAPSIAGVVHAADWHEREIEDLFGIRFSGHPVLGDFVLHDATWPEDVAPMRREYDLHAEVDLGRRRDTWRPRTLLKQAGAHALPIGPVYGDVTEAVLYVLESTGEQVRRCIPRPFYKYRAVGKLAEGMSPESAVLLAERFSGSSAFAHALAFARAVEASATTAVPERAEWLRVVFAELERIRSHLSSIAAICGSTALAVAKANAQLIEEELLRLSARVARHRYLFGVCVPGGVAVDLSPDDVELLRSALPDLVRRAETLERGLRFSSSFLDRLEEVGILERQTAFDYGCLGPVARASGVVEDARAVLPYAAYPHLEVAVAGEDDGDGFARLRVLFAEVRASLKLILAALEGLPSGPVAAAVEPGAGAAVVAVEAPAGTTYHWVRLGPDGRVLRHHVASPSLRNLHAFPAAAEGYAYQDFPIILSTFNLSIAEADR
jgi:Ni,Fe-hydrogenase III large subunit/Ni,Fe-hydrogenase III component G